MLPRAYTTSPPTNAPAVTINSPTIDSTIGTVRSAGLPARMTSEIDEHDQGDDHQRRVERRARSGGPIRIDVVGGARHRGREHEQDGREERDVGADALAEQIEHDGHEERADRDVRDGRVHGMAEPRPVQQILDRPDRPEEAPEPAMVEIAEAVSPRRPGPPRCAPANRAIAGTSLQSECIHRRIHIGGKFGDNFLRAAWRHSWTSGL